MDFPAVAGRNLNTFGEYSVYSPFLYCYLVFLTAGVDRYRGRTDAVGRLYGQRGLPGFAGTLQQYLGQSVESLQTEGTGIGISRTFGRLPSRITVAHTQNAYRTFHGQQQLIAGCRHPRTTATSRLSALIVSRSAVNAMRSVGPVVGTTVVITFLPFL